MNGRQNAKKRTTTEKKENNCKIMQKQAKHAQTKRREKQKLARMQPLFFCVVFRS